MADNFDKMGKTMEFKREHVEITHCNSLSDKSEVIPALEAALSRHEIDGWKADVESSLSTQNATGKDADGTQWVNTHFRRWV